VGQSFFKTRSINASCERASLSALSVCLRTPADHGALNGALDGEKQEAEEREPAAIGKLPPRKPHG